MQLASLSAPSGHIKANKYKKANIKMGMQDTRGCVRSDSEMLVMKTLVQGPAQASVWWGGCAGGFLKGREVH